MQKKKKDLCSVWRRCDRSDASKVIVKFHVRDFFWVMLHSQVDWFKLIAID